MKDIIKKALTEFVIEGLKGIAKGVIKSSYWICLITCLVALILYIAGEKKAGRYVSISFIIYFILQCLKGAIE